MLVAKKFIADEVQANKVMANAFLVDKTLESQLLDNEVQPSKVLDTFWEVQKVGDHMLTILNLVRTIILVYLINLVLDLCLNFV